MPFTVKNKCALLVVFIVLGLSVAVTPAWANEFRTPEYNASTGLESMKAADAYGLGFSGQGVLVGVIDDSIPKQQNEFANKFPAGALYFAKPDPEDTHGIHVGGIIAAHKNDIGMHGVAWGANLLMATPLSYTSEALQKFLRYPNARIINNSWGNNYHLDVNYSPAFWRNWKQDEALLLTVAPQLVKQDKLLIFAAGNEGHLGPDMEAGLPTRFVEQNIPGDLDKNWLSIIAYDVTQPTTSAAFVGIFSNMGGYGASEYSLMAPGMYINSTISDSKYEISSGTSMAAPNAAGVAALVSQAFPYMGGKQIADVLLSTTTPMTSANWPKALVLYRNFYNDKGKRDSDKDVLMVYYPDNAPLPALSKAEKERLYKTMGEFSYPDGTTRRELEQFLQTAMANATALPEDQYAELFGKGVINAYRAVQGPGYFDATRLAASDLSVGHFGGNYAMYTVNSQGVDSTFSNDIGQVKATDPASPLNNLDVGLHKLGLGVLFLTGINTFAGPSVVDGGVLALGKAGGNARAELAGSVFVGEQGVFTGNGLVRGDLNSYGTLIPGLHNQAGTVLTVRGNMLISGQTMFVLGEHGQANKLRGLSDITFNGADFKVLGENGAPVSPRGNYANLVSAAGALRLINPDSAVYDLSPYLSFYMVQNGNDLSLLSVTTPLGYYDNVPWEIDQVADALQVMNNGLNNDPRQEELDFLYNLDQERFISTVAGMRGDIHASTLTNLPFDNVLANTLAGDPGRNGALLSQGPTQRAAGENNSSRTTLWLQPLLNYSRSDGQRETHHDSVHANMQGAVLGVERRDNNLAYGLLAAIGTNTLSEGSARADIDDFRLGLYGRYAPCAFSVSGLAHAGMQNYKTQRHIDLWRTSPELSSSYRGDTLGAGLMLAYNTLYTVSGKHSLSPYLGVNLDYIHQREREESGDGVYALQVNSTDVNRLNMRAGLMGEFNLDERINLIASAGYRRLLSGDNPGLDAAFIGDTSSGFMIIGPDESKDTLTYSLGLRAMLDQNLSLSGTFYGETSSSRQQYMGFLTISYSW